MPKILPRSALWCWHALCPRMNRSAQQNSGPQPHTDPCVESVQRNDLQGNADIISRFGVPPCAAPLRQNTEFTPRCRPMRLEVVGGGPYVLGEIMRPFRRDSCHDPCARTRIVGQESQIDAGPRKRIGIVEVTAPGALTYARTPKRRAISRTLSRLRNDSGTPNELDLITTSGFTVGSSTDDQIIVCIVRLNPAVLTYRDGNRWGCKARPCI
jgi:hypothetical protein